jgi:DNA-binding PadR family transcriptional regulator
MSNSSDCSPELTLIGIQTRVVKEFLDVIVLCELSERKELTGYEIAVLGREKFGVALSPGTVYMTMYAMERRGLIEGKNDSKKTTFCLTVKGERTLGEISRAAGELADFMKGLLTF